jgi:hypothetical protein
MVTVLVLFCVMYMLSWWAKNRIRTALLLTSGVFFVAAILLSDKDLVGIAATLLLLPLLGKVRWGKPPEESLNVRTESYDEAMGIHRIQSVNPMHDDWSYW